MVSFDVICIPRPDGFELYQCAQYILVGVVVARPEHEHEGINKGFLAFFPVVKRFVKEEGRLWGRYHGRVERSQFGGGDALEAEGPK